MDFNEDSKNQLKTNQENDDKILSENASWGKVIRIDDLKSIVFPKGILDIYLNRNKYNKKVLIVFSPNKNNLKIDVFPIEDTKIIKVTMKLTKFSGTTVKSISQLIRQYEIPKNLFTLGVCLKENLCIYEQYIEESKLKINIEELKNELLKIENVKDINIETISVE
ncbi:MAG: hypothetical protein ACTSXF_08055 [Promethearchaeota archaeon]